MVSPSEVQSANPAHLASNTFFVNLAVSFNVTSISLAIFILIMVCIACILLLTVLILIIRCCVHQRFVSKPKRRPVKSIYLDEIPGTVPADTPNKFGTLEYSLEYNLQNHRLTVGVIQANILHKRKEDGEPDLYVSVKLFGKKEHNSVLKGKIHKTAVRKSTIHPTWQQTFAYDVSEHDLVSTVLVLEVFDYDNIGQDRSIGQLTVPLKDVDEADYAGQILEVTGWLEPCESMVDGIGEICIGLKYDPHNKMLEVTILEARQLTIADQLSSGSNGRLLVHIHVKSGRKKLGSSDTNPKVEVINPYFNEKMTFPIKSEDIEDCMVICSLKGYTGMGRKKTLGFVMMGHVSEITTGVKQWEDMLSSPSRIRVMWHTILPGSSTH